MALCMWMTAAFAFSSDNDPIFIALLGAVLGVILFVKGFRDFQLKRLIRDTPAAKVRSAAIGLVEMQGVSVGPYTITSPVQQRACFYYRTQLWRWVQREKDSEWVSVADERMHVPFYLKDNTGMVLVDPNGATVDIHRDYHEEFNTSLFSSSAPGPGAIAFIQRYGLSSGTKVKLEEYTIRPDNPIFILGTLATNSGLRPCAMPLPTAGSGMKVHGVPLSFSSGSSFLGSLAAGGLAAAEGVAVNINSQFTTVHVDKDGNTTTVTRTATGGSNANGTLKPGDPRASAAVAVIAAKDPELAQKIAAHLNVPYPPPAGAATSQPTGQADVVKMNVKGPWATGPAASAIVAAIAARDPALAAIVGGHLGINAAPAADPPAPAPGEWPDHDPTVIQQGTHDPHYYISWRSQKEVLSSLAWHSFLSIFGGPVLTLLCAWYLLGRMGIH